MRALRLRVLVDTGHDTMVALKGLEGELFFGLDAFLAHALDFHGENLFSVVCGCVSEVSVDSRGAGNA